MKPVYPGSSTSKGRSKQESKFKKKSIFMKRKDQQRSLKKYWKMGEPLVAQVPHNRHAFYDEETSSSESDEETSSSESDDQSEDENSELQHSNEEEHASPSNGCMEKKIATYMAKKSGLIILIMNHPTSFTINGTAAINVISGTVSILGYELNASEDLTRVFSSKDIFQLSVETTSCERKTLTHLAALEKKLELLLHESQRNDIREQITDTSVLIVLHENLMAGFVRLAQRHEPSALPLFQTPYNLQLASMGFTVSGSDEDSSIKLSPDHCEAAEMIKSDINTFIRIGRKAPRIFIYGPKGLGKSTSLRYFINKVLSSNYGKRILFLDIDPGQPEFTLPGCISLTEVRGPLLGPSYTHLKTPIMSKFFGHVALENPLRYLSLLGEVLDEYLTEFSDDILFINTLGWIKGIGLEVLEYVHQRLKPTIEIELYLESPCFSKIGSDVSGSRKLKIPGHYRSAQSARIEAATLRNIRIWSYFGKCDSTINPCVMLNKIKPYVVSLSDFAIHIFSPEGMDFNVAMESIVGSILALCIVAEDEIIHPADENAPLRLRPESSFGNCVGFGYVRAFNFVEKVLYILTPLEFINLRHVNALIKGRIECPIRGNLK